MRQLSFKIIADTENELKERVLKINDTLKQFPNVELKTDFFVRKCGFNMPEGEVTDYRLRVYVSKDKQTTWNQIMGAINDIKAVPYEFV